MSSTNRSNARDSHISDYYVTPSKPILDLFEALKESECCDLFTANDGKLHWWLFSFCFSFIELQLETVSKAFHITFSIVAVVVRTAELSIKNLTNQVQKYLSIKPKPTIATMHCYMMAF